MATTTEFSDEWELSKENVRPRKQGRNVSSLSAALQPQDDQMAKIKQEKQLFESELRMYTGDDPLDTWDRYIRWTEEVYPKGGKDGKLKALLERCVIIFKDEEKYKNDHRYIEAWIKFACFCSDPIEIFAFMFDQCIGSEVAMLYDAWATALEDAGNTKKADTIYQEGLNRNAEPMDFLIRKHQEFQARVARGLMASPEDMDTGVSHSVRSVSGRTEDQEDEQRTALGQLKARGKRHQVGTTRTGHAKIGENAYYSPKEDFIINRFETSTASAGGIKSDVKPKQTPGMGFQIFNDENADPSNQPKQTGEWETVPKTGSTNRENEQKPGPWNKARVAQKTAAVGARSTPSFTVHIDEDAGRPMVTPQKVAHIDSQVLSARKPEKPANPLAHIQQLAPTGGLEQRPMYNKAKIYRGLEEFSFEELREARWQVKCRQKQDQERQKQEQERRLAEERHKIQEEAERLRAARQELVDFQRSLQEQMQQERQQMMQDLRNQMALQQEHLENQRRAQTEKAQIAIDEDIQQRLQKQLNISRTPDTQENSSERLTRQLTFDDMTSHGNTENLPRVCSQLNEGRGSEGRGRRVLQPDPSTSLNSSQRTPVFDTSVNSSRSSSGPRPKSRGPTPESGSFHHGRVSLTAPSPTVNTQEALKVVRGMFNASLDCERQFAWQGEEMIADVSRAPGGAVSSGVASQPFAIYDESEEQNGTSPMVVNQDPSTDKENTPPKDYRPAPRRHHLSGYLQPALDIPVDPEGEQDVVMVETEKVKPNEESPVDYIEHMPPSDVTLAPLGSSESFAAAACLASTPYCLTGKFSELPNPPVSHIKAPPEDQHSQDKEKDAQSQTAQQPSFDVSIAPSSKLTLSPIMEGSTEGSGEESKCHPSQASSKHHVTTTELCPNSLTTIPDDARTHHEIDLADYVPPEPDEKTEALLSMSVMINPHDPFDPTEIEDTLSNLSRPLEEYDNYYSMPIPVPDITNGAFVTLGSETYTIETCVGKGAFGSVYKAVTFDMNFDDMCNMDVEDKSLAVKVQKPACPWEFYICSEIGERLKRLRDPMDVSESLMSINQGFFFTNGSCLITDFLNRSLLSLVNYIKPQKSLRADMEPLVMFMTIELLHMVEKLHKCQIIHGDIKPDNFLVRGIPCMFGQSTKEEVFGRSTQCLRLIDFGRSIDMTRYPPGTTFLAKSTTRGFQCIEMRTDMPWTYQTDLFGLIGTIHVLIFCEYMKVYQSSGVWHMTGSFQRKWNVNLWKSVFHRLLNIPSCDELPDLCAIRKELEDYFMSHLVSKYNQSVIQVVTHLNDNNV